MNSFKKFILYVYILFYKYLFNNNFNLITHINDMVEEVEPNELLIKYFQDSKSLFTDFDSSKREFIENEEWHYVTSNIELNIFLLQRLDERNLLRNENNICDCGIGLGTTLFDMYLQSKLFTDGKKFNFYGIEKQKSYIEFLNKNLLQYWEGNLSIIEDDIMNQDYSKYNIVYTYTPFKTTEKLEKLYNKIISEVSTGSLLIEHKNSGLGLHGILTELEGVRKLKIDDIVVFQKI